MNLSNELAFQLLAPVVQEDISCLELWWPLCLISLNMKIALLLEIIN